MISMELYVAEQTMNRRANEVLRQAQAERGSVRRVCCAMLVWLGHRLIAWGSSLQRRYSIAASPAPRSASPLAG